MNKPSLEQLQSQFIHGIYAPDEHSADFIRAGEEPGVVLSPDEQLSVYRGSVLGGLAQALGDIYPAIKRSVGEQFFDAMALRYAKQQPSHSASLDDYGANFHSFIASFEALKDYPYLADLAQLEWHWHRCFHAENPQVFDPSNLASLSPEQHNQICFELQSSLTLMQSDYPIVKLWQLNQEIQEHQEQPDDADSDLTIDLNESTYIALWRDGLVTRISELNEQEWQLLNSLKKSQSLGTIFSSLGSIIPVETINALLAECLQRTWITGFKLESAN